MIINDDCLKVMKGMEDKSVDVVFSDPPYNAKKDYGVYKDNLPLDKYIAWMQEVVNESIRISRNGVLFYVSGKLTSIYYRFLPDAHLIPIHKKAAGVASGNYMLQYHSLFSTVRPVNKIRDLWDDIRLPGEGYFFREKRYPNPGLTSLLLTEKVIYNFTKEGDIVFDPFTGVGTTPVACKKLNRKFVGTELNPEYIQVAEERLK